MHIKNKISFIQLKESPYIPHMQSNIQNSLHTIKKSISIQTHLILKLCHGKINTNLNALEINKKQNPKLGIRGH